MKKHLNMPSFTPNAWMNCKKTESFNEKFMKLPSEEN